MKRKLILHGSTSHILSLPIEWVREQNLESGDEVEIIPRKGELLIVVPREHQPKKTTIPTADLNRFSLYFFLLNLYRNGYDEVLITFQKQSLFDPETNAEVSILPLIRRWLPRYVGWEIMQQDKDKILIKDITGQSQEDVEHIIKRVIFLIDSFLAIEIDFFQKKGNVKDERVEPDINDFHQTAVRLVNLSIRTANKNNDSAEKIILLHHLYLLSRKVRYMHSLNKSLPIKKKEKVLAAYDLTRSLLSKILSSKSLLGDIAQKRFELERSIQKQKKSDTTFSYHFLAFLEEIKELISIGIYRVNKS